MRDNNVFSSDLKILYIDKLPRLETHLDTDNIKNCIVSSLLGLCEINICNQKLLLKPDQIVFLGLDDNIVPENEKILLSELEIMHFTLERIKKIGIDKILKFIINSMNEHPIHVVINMEFFESMFDHNEITKIIESLRNKVVSIDITGYNASSLNNTKDVNILKLMRLFMVDIMSLKEKKINIFSEDTRFLIYRPIEQENSDDIGWYILRFTDLNKREEILKKIDADDIVNITIDDDDGEEIDIYVTSTTISEQEQMSYYTATNILDKCLFPTEKVSMLFELVNTPSDNSMNKQTF